MTTTTTKTACDVCGETVDPILVATGHARHLLCAPDQPAPATTSAADLASMVTAAIRTHAANLPRTLQTDVGPSELGHPCARKLAYRLAGTTPVNTGSDPFPSFVGTGGHRMMDDVFSHERHNGRYILEQRVNVGAGVTGSCDCYDTQTACVIDWKFVGPTALRRYKTQGPSDQYRTQIHLYGQGYVNAGQPVTQVAIVFLPRGGMLADLVVWTEPFDPNIAQAATDRWTQIVILADALGIPENPAAIGHVPPTPHDCAWCPFYRPFSTDLATGCPGDSATRAAGAAADLQTLIK